MTGYWRRTLFLLSAFVACASPSEPGEAYTVRDSVGIRIVQNHRPQLDGDDAWRIEPRPTTQIGGTEAEGLAALYRVSDATRLTDGTLVVANAGTSELRFFTRDADPFAAVGGYGGGPGEFEDLYHLEQLPGDSVLVFDGILGRTTTFSGDGQLGSVQTLEVGPGVGYLFFRGHVQDGWLLTYRGWTSAEDTLPLRTHRYPTRRTLVLIGPNEPDTVGTFPGSEHFVLVREGRPTYTSAPFPFVTYELATQGRILRAQSDRYEVRRVSWDGQVVEIIRRVAAPVPIREDHVEWFRTVRLNADDSPRNRRTIEAIIEGAGLPEHLPLISGLLGDTEGNIWVESYGEPDDTASTWSVFSGDGRWLTDVEVPGGGRILEIGSTYLLGVWRDSLDVEQVRLYDLVRPGG